MSETEVHYLQPSFDLEKVVSANIRAITALRGYKQADVAQALGLNKSALSFRWNDKRPWSINDVVRVADFLDVPFTRFFEVDSINGGQPKLTAVRDSYTAWDLNPEPSDSEKVQVSAVVTDIFSRERVTLEA